MILAQRILDCLRANGPVSSAELPNWFRDTDHIDFDITLKRLMKQNSVSLTLGKYDLVAQKPGSGRAPFIATPVGEPVSQLGCSGDVAPSAAEEVAASLRPAVPITRERFECPLCHKLRFDAEFRHSALGKRYVNCKYCEQLKTQATRQKRYAETINGGSGDGLGNVPPERPTKPTAPTPAAPSNTTATLQVGSPEPPATSSEHSSEQLAHGTRNASVGPENPEALSPVGAADGNSVLMRISAKRERITQQIADLMVQLAEVNELEASVVALLEEGGLTQSLWPPAGVTTVPDPLGTAGQVRRSVAALEAER
jgi:hypothetical protein